MSGSKKGIKGTVVECPADGEVSPAARSIHFVRRGAKFAGEDLRVVGPRPREVCIAASGQRSLDRVIESGIAEMEDYYLAADTLNRVRKGQERVHSAASVRNDLGLDD